MSQPVGTQFIIFKPNIKAASLGTQLPPINLGMDGDWNALITATDATKWFNIPHTDEGVTISPSAPKDDISSDQAGGAIGVVPSGESEITIGFTPITYNLDLFTWLASLQIAAEVAAVAATTTSPAYPAYKRLALTPEGKQFMFGIEGRFAEGSFTDKGGFVRAFGYKVEQTNEVDVNMRRTGDDAVVRLEAEVRCLVTTVTAAQLANTGITSVDNRFDMFVIPNV